ncbi:MAG: TonB-dependent receptor [candidate division KSB1 bacterium]|nr:TonB-dependent receptor [candidate division KSB1 bacterium]MDZ7272814.1 TonB-dependent receptor [candidate division KSB1 bacterium]MDZ7284162.1 TonB-dependent receptor [candidate division KSB1 bacterium]MDZ7297440.1 TonB-dependent receptor [candidate division KSB1 bacterium]MDZ7308188.1 TonB-dependent receptor [candidate division KSB1 bacterium]
MKSLFAFWCGVMMMLTATSAAQEGAVLSGTVRDRETHAALPGCHLHIEGTSLRTLSDTQGRFRLPNVAPGRVVLVATFIGYETLRQPVTINQPEVHVTLALQPQPLVSPTVTVIATRARARHSPVAFATLTREAIAESHPAQDIPVLLSELPAIKFYSENGNGLGYNYLSIRGFDQRRIAVLINGVPQNDPEDHNVYWIDFPDLLANAQDIQVQRGAGSAFYGPPAIGGSVNIVTSDFSRQRGLTLTLGGGSFNTRKYSLSAASGLLAGKYLFSGRLSRMQSDGYREQSWVDLKSYFVGAARLGKNSITRLHFYGGPIADHLAYYGIPKEQARQRATRRHNPIRRPDEIENFNQPHLELLHEQRFAGHWRLNNTWFAIRGYGFFDYDGSWAPLSYYRLTPAYGFPVPGDPEETYVDSLLIRAYVDNFQTGWLPQLTWQHPRGAVTVGAEWRRHRSLHWGRIQKGDSGLPAATAGEYRGRDYIGRRRYYEYRGAQDVLSPYLHANWLAHPKLNVTFDLQYAYSRYRLYDEQFIGTSFTMPYHFLNPRAGVNYNLTSHLNLFASLSRTSRAPRLKNLYDAAEASTPDSWGAVRPQFEITATGQYDFGRPLVKPERLTDLELGLGFHRGEAHAAANFFYMDFRDEIIKSGRLDRFGQPVTGNAERTLHAGLELAASLPLTSHWQCSGNLMLSSNELRRHVVYDSDGTARVLDGNPIAGFPNVLANARLRFAQAGWQASLALQHVGKQYTDNFKNEANTVPAYTVVHASAGWRLPFGTAGSAVLLQLHVQNLFDRLYIAHGEGEEFFPAAGRQVFVNLKGELNR